MCFDPNTNVAVFLSSVSLRHLTQSNHSYSFLVPLTIYIYIHYVYLYMYEYKYIYSRYMNIYKNVYSVRRLVVYILLCENSCQSQTVV